VITQNDIETAVLISYTGFRKLKATALYLADFLLSSPLRESEIDLSRSKDTGGQFTFDFEQEFE
jgi:hypothetical protein